jgi:hypothetical protein
MFLQSIELYAQTCDQELYAEYIKDAECFIKEKSKNSYLEAVKSYSSALAICPAKAQEVKKALEALFIEINELKEIAEAEKIRAEQAQQKTEEQRQKA